MRFTANEKVSLRFLTHGGYKSGADVFAYRRIEALVKALALKLRGPPESLYFQLNNMMICFFQCLSYKRIFSSRRDPSR